MSGQSRARLFQGRLLWVGFLTTLIYVGCTRVQPADPGPTLLLGDIPSRIGPAEAQHALDANDNWRILDEVDDDDSALPVQLRRVLVEPHSHLGQEGSALLWFYQDQLDSIYFVPKDKESYLRALNDHYGLDLAQGAEARFSVGTRIAVRDDYVVWEDATLTDKRRRATS